MLAVRTGNADGMLAQMAVTSMESRSPIVRTVHTRVRLRQPLSVHFARHSMDSVHYITLAAENNWTSAPSDFPQVPPQPLARSAESSLSDRDGARTTTCTGQASRALLAPAEHLVAKGCHQAAHHLAKVGHGKERRRDQARRYAPVDARTAIRANSNLVLRTHQSLRSVLTQAIHSQVPQGSKSMSVSAAARKPFKLVKIDFDHHFRHTIEKVRLLIVPLSRTTKRLRA